MVAGHRRPLGVEQLDAPLDVERRDEAAGLSAHNAAAGSTEISGNPPGARIGRSQVTCPKGARHYQAGRGRRVEREAALTDANTKRSPALGARHRRAEEDGDEIAKLCADLAAAGLIEPMARH